jgi:glycosyltransferase involved in cell wall biosynthesis
MGSLDVRVHRATARTARTNVCVSGYLEGRLGLTRATSIYNPVPSAALRYVASPPRDRVVASAGRFVAEKGFDVLLRALALAPDVRARIAGDGPVRPGLEALADDLGIRPRVEFLGPLPLEGVLDLYASADVVCVPSIWNEPFGYAAAEAMAMGASVVAMPVGAMPELLGGDRGYLAERPTAEALAASLDVALGDGTGQGPGREAKVFAETELSLGVIGARYVRAYGSG